MTTILPLVPKYLLGGTMTATWFSTYDCDLARFCLNSQILPRLFARCDCGFKPHRQDVKWSQVHHATSAWSFVCIYMYWLLVVHVLSTQYLMLPDNGNFSRGLLMSITKCRWGCWTVVQIQLMPGMFSVEIIFLHQTALSCLTVLLSSLSLPPKFSSWGGGGGGGLLFLALPALFSNPSDLWVFTGEAEGGWQS